MPHITEDALATYQRVALDYIQLLHATTWRQMDSAPKDGTDVLLRVRDDLLKTPNMDVALVGHWVDSTNNWKTSHVSGYEWDDPCDMATPVAWMPLPKL